MANFSAKILNNSVGALAAQQAVIATTANNIANVNTPGYARRTIDLQTRVTRGDAGQIDVGNGVQIGRVSRITDEFLERILRAAGSDQGSARVQNEMLGRIERLFDLTGRTDTINDNLVGFFNAVNDLTTNPSSIELRSNLIQAANNLVSSISSTYNEIAALQTEADRRIAGEIGTVNSLTTQIAELNGLIASREAATGSVAGDERDRRTQLLEQLAGKLNYSTVEQADGSVNIFLGNGFSLVNGTTANQIGTTNSPSFASGTLPPSLDGGTLSYIVYDYSGGAGTAEIDLTREITGGTIGGLIAMRGYADPNPTPPGSPFLDSDGTLVAVASRIEGIARMLVTQVNETYLGPDNDSVTAGHQPSSADLDGNPPAVFGLFTFTGANDEDGDGLPTLTDLQLLADNDGISNIASRLRVTITDPRDVAAARDSDPGTAGVQWAPGDGSNMQAIADLQADDSLIFVAGNYSYTGTFEGAYSETVSYVSNEKRRADTAQRVADSSYEAALDKRDEISAVSLDEEFTALVKFQKAYQAAARMIRVGEQLLDEIINLL